MTDALLRYLSLGPVARKQVLRHVNVGDAQRLAMLEEHLPAALRKKKAVIGNADRAALKAILQSRNRKKAVSPAESAHMQDRSSGKFILSLAKRGGLVDQTAGLDDLEHRLEALGDESCHAPVLRELLRATLSEKENVTPDQIK